MHFSRIAGVGHYVPANIITNDDLAKRMNTSDAWIQERTGIKERRFFEPGKDTVASMAARASEMALERAGIDKSEVDFIVFATITSDYYFPGSGVLMQREMGLGTIGALDIKVQCTGFIYALSIADQFIRTGMYKTILVVGAEIQSTALDISDAGRSTAVIFGDGAGACVLTRADEPGIYSTHLHADGTYAEELVVMDPGSSRPVRDFSQMTDFTSTRVHMQGNSVFKHAVTRFPEVINEALAANNYTAANIDLLVPHQANARITQYIAAQMGLPPEKVVSNIDRYGNTTAASIPIALSEAWAEGRLKPGHLLCMAAFGSGFTWGSALVRW